MAELQATLVTMSVDTDLVSPDYRTIVCEETSEGGLDSTTTDTPTKCGTFTAVSTPAGTITGSGVVQADPQADEVSFQEILGWVNNKTKLAAVYQNDAEGTTSVGEAVFMAGEGYFTSARVTAQEGDLVKFNWAFSFSGPVDTAYPAS